MHAQEEYNNVCSRRLVQTVFVFVSCLLLEVDMLVVGLQGGWKGQVGFCNINDKLYVMGEGFRTCQCVDCSSRFDGLQQCNALADALPIRIYGPVGKEPQQRSLLLTSRIHHPHSHSSPGCGECNARLISVKPLHLHPRPHPRRGRGGECDSRASMCCLVGA